MKDGKAYFTQQEEEVSNKYMSANGDNPSLDKEAGTRNKWYNSWLNCSGFDYECGIKRLAIFGLIAYVVYRVIKKKK